MTALAEITGKKLPRMTLRARFVLVLVVVALVPLLIYSTVNQVMGRAALRERAYEALSNAARFNALKVDSFLSSALATVEVAANLRELEGFLQRHKDGVDGVGEIRSQGVLETLNRVAENDRVFIVSVALLDRDGWNVADTRRWGIGRNESATPAFMNAMLSGLPAVQSQRRPGDEVEKELCFSAPLFDGDRFIGVLRISYDLAAVRHAIISGVGMAGPSSFPLVIDERDRLVVAATSGETPDPERLGRVLGEVVPAVTFSIPREDGLENAWMGASASLDNSRWRVFYLQEKGFFFAPIDRQLRFSLLMCAGLLVLASIVSWWSARRMVAPLYALRHSAERIAAGEWSVQTKGASSQEIAALERAFTGMARELERRERELIEAKSKAEASVQAKDDFLAVMTHEVRTPLNTIIGFCNLIIEEGSASREHLEYIRKMETGAHRLLVMINEILDFSRLEAGRMEISQRRFSVEELFSDVVAICGHTPWEKGLEIFFHIGPGVPHELVGDLRSLTQILANLIGNAVKFTEQGGVVVEVESLDSPDHPELRFSVSDTGAGLPPGVGQDLFEPFTQADATTRRRHSGTGLGLAICKRLVEALGGEIGFDLAYAQGARFTFTLPLDQSLASVFVAPPVPAGVHLPLLSKSAFFRREMRLLLGTLGITVDALDANAADALPSRAPVVLIHWNEALAASPTGRAIREGRFPPAGAAVIVLLQPTLPESRLPDALREATVLNNPVFSWEVADALRRALVERDRSSGVS